MRRPLTIFGNVFILKRNPWYSPRLRAALAGVGKVPKKPEYIIAAPPPWFGGRYEAMSPEQIERLRRFSEVASRTAGMRIEERLKTIQAELRTGRKPRPRRIKPRKFHEIVATITPRPAAAPPAVTAR